MLHKLTSASITTSAPYVRENGVSPVDLRGVIRYAHKTLGSSSAQLPFAPSSLRFFQPSLQAVHDYLVHDLSLAIALGICWSRIHIPDTEIIAKFAKTSTVKLQPVIRYKGIRDPEPGNYILPYELLHVYIPDIGQSLCLCPFGEIINGYQHESSITRCSRKRPEYVQPPLCEGPRTANRVQMPDRLVYQRGMLLTLLTLLNIFRRVLLHLGPPESLSHFPVCQ